MALSQVMGCRRNWNKSRRKGHMMTAGHGLRVPSNLRHVFGRDKYLRKRIAPMMSRARNAVEVEISTRIMT